MSQASRTPEAESAVAQLQQALTAFVRKTTTFRVALPNGQSLERSAYATLFRLQCAGPQRGSELAHELGLDLSTVSRQVAGLVRQGLVRKTSDPDDGRAWLLELTAAGRRLVQQGMAARETFLDELLVHWTEDDLRTFGQLLDRFNAALDARRVVAERAS
ncbi:MAG TPA: MarR family transcriptional regulator [Mycobacteriales bacterium]|nr:MarR family transcriptional regulator [Mycobacteriales bacterium]